MVLLPPLGAAPRPCQPALLPPLELLFGLVSRFRCPPWSGSPALSALTAARAAAIVTLAEIAGEVTPA